VDLTTFRASLAETEPAVGLALPLQALWWDAKDDWSRAHTCAQQDEGATGTLVHAYLHRKEGDLSNAGYWYRRAGRPMFQGPPDAEWTVLAQELLDA
jgi:hypothetical protein